MTLTREQVIEMANECGFVAYGEDAGEYRIPTPAFHSRMERLAALAYTAGRAAGLVEAVEAVLSKVSHPDDPNNSVWSAAYDCVANECAAAIEQLKEQSK